MNDGGCSTQMILYCSGEGVGRQTRFNAALWRHLFAMTNQITERIKKILEGSKARQLRSRLLLNCCGVEDVVHTGGGNTCPL